ncbi:ISL3 family transposase (plasmid) [Rhodococcus qingshengii]|nr:ISL3 family transposase [Rhodococcus qingshengii]
MKVLYTFLDHHRTHIADYRPCRRYHLPNRRTWCHHYRRRHRREVHPHRLPALEPDPTCPSCGQLGLLRDHVQRVLTDLPVVGHPTRLHLRIPRFTCHNDSCSVTVFRQRIDRVAPPKASTTHRTTRWILERLAFDKMSVSAVAKTLGLGGDVVNSLAVSIARHLVHERPGHLDGVQVLGVDEHKWKHVRGQGAPSFVTVIVDLTPVIDGIGPARLLDMVAGRSAAALTGWLRERDQPFRDRVKIVSMDGFAGYHRAAKNALLQARTVMDPFHVVHLAAEKLTVCRQRIQQITLGHRGRSGDPLYGIKRVLPTRKKLRTDKQNERLEAVFADEQHIDVEVTERIYQDLVAAYADTDKRTGKLTMFKTLKRLKSGAPKELAELAQLGRSLWKRRKEILAYFDTGASNGPVEAINGRLEQTGTQNMNDDERDAWQLHHHGVDWDEIGTEMGCSPTAAQTLAAAYEKRTDAAAHTAQNTLF